ncbi:AB-hydrolase YheT [Hymenopellis radicata]|nr:AB-hydrolase YheT [Hymenopellis radicata]
MASWDLLTLALAVILLTAITFIFGPTHVSSIVAFPRVPSHVILNKPGEQNGSTVTIQEAISTCCKSLFEKYRAPWWLFNGHLQTIYCVIGDFSRVDQIKYRRQLVRLTDGGTLGLDFAPTNDLDLDDDTPIVVVQHGLTGGAFEPYVRAVLHPVCTPVEQGGLGYRAVVVNFRGCAGVPVTTPRLFSAGGTDDLRQALMYISRLYPNAPLLGLGFSLGANVLTRYLAEEGHRSKLNSACILACPWDLLLNDDILSSRWLTRELYAKGMGGNLLALVKRHHDALLHEPEHAFAKAVLSLLSVKSPTIRDYHQTFGRFDGPPPLFPFPSAADYYKGMSSYQVIGDVKVPFLSINALDDPIVQHVPLHGGDNGLVTMVLTPSGGHLGWFQSRSSRWTTRPVLEWLQLVGEKMEGVRRDPRPSIVDSEGWIREHGAKELGCKPVAGGGIIDGNRGEAGTLQGL